jgi:hypothetical protein
MWAFYVYNMILLACARHTGVDLTLPAPGIRADEGFPEDCCNNKSGFQFGGRS